MTDNETKELLKSMEAKVGEIAKQLRVIEAIQKTQQRTKEQEQEIPRVENWWLIFVDHAFVVLVGLIVVSAFAAVVKLMFDILFVW